MPGALPQHGKMKFDMHVPAVVVDFMSTILSSSRLCKQLIVHGRGLGKTGEVVPCSDIRAILP